MKPISPNLHALSPYSTPVDLGNINVSNPLSFNSDIIFTNSDHKQVLNITTDDNKKIVCEWGEDTTHLISLNHLEGYLKDLISPDLRKAIVRELKVKMNSDIKTITKDIFNLNEK